MFQFHSQALRAFDANLDRASEGLRVMEDVARFCLDSAVLTSRLKKIRHQLLSSSGLSSIDLLSARAAADDVGKENSTAKEQADDLIETVIANARRTEQSVRVLEELSRLPDAAADSHIFEEIRFAVYQIEKELVGIISRQAKISRLSGNYYIAHNVDEMYGVSLSSGTSFQLNIGDSNRKELWQQAVAADKLCRETGALLIISEYTDIARGIKADGVAINGGSLPPELVRRLLSIEQLIGYSATDPAEAVNAAESGVDYLICSDARLREELSLKVGVPVILARPGDIR